MIRDRSSSTNHNHGNDLESHGGKDGFNRHTNGDDATISYSRDIHVCTTCVVICLFTMHLNMMSVRTV